MKQKDPRIWGQADLGSNLGATVILAKNVTASVKSSDVRVKDSVYTVRGRCKTANRRLWFYCSGGGTSTLYHLQKCSGP